MLFSQQMNALQNSAENKNGGAQRLFRLICVLGLDCRKTVVLQTRSLLVDYLLHNLQGDTDEVSDDLCLRCGFLRDSEKFFAKSSQWR